MFVRCVESHKSCIAHKNHSHVYRVNTTSLLQIDMKLKAASSFGLLGSSLQLCTKIANFISGLVYIANKSVSSYDTVGPDLTMLQRAQWIRFCATNRKFAGSIPAGVIGIFH